MEPMVENRIEKSRRKLKQIFEFLEALHQSRNPVKTRFDQQLWFMGLDRLPSHECVEPGWSADINSRRNDDAEGSWETGAVLPYVLRVKRPLLTEAPEPPLVLRAWLKDGWRNVDERAEYLPSKTVGKGRIRKFTDNPERQTAFAEWVEQRQLWVTDERVARKAMAIFEKLYALYNQIEREAEQVELMLGDGVLFWDMGDGEPIQHPLLLRRVQLRFDPSVPEFTVVETDSGPELYTSLLRILPEVRASAIAELIGDLERNGYQPLGTTETEDFLKRIVTQISPYGKFSSIPPNTIHQKTPVIFRQPVLFLRRRSLGFQIALERILEDLEETSYLPASVLNIAGIETQTHSRINTTSEATDVNGHDERVLLTKEANAEQLQIALRLDEYGAVLVQGPPGTGKTHTIANILGHLLAQGKSVLVTSHTAKALRVLRDKVAGPLQSLCVSVLENDSESRKQMEEAVDAIAEGLSALHADVLDQEATVLTQHRSELLQDLRTLRNSLQLARQDEYRPIVVAGQSFEPAEAARKIRREQDSHGWIPGPVILGDPLPLSVGELVELYATNEALSRQSEQELQMQLASPDIFCEPATFYRWSHVCDTLRDTDFTFGEDLWTNPAEPASIQIMEELQMRLSEVAASLMAAEPWRLAVISAGLEGGGFRQAWEALLTEIEDVYHQAAEAHALLFRYDVEIAEDLPYEKAVRTSTEILQYVQTHGKLNGVVLLFKPEWKRFIAQAKLDNRSPSDGEHFRVLNAWLQLQIARQQLTASWRRLMTEAGGPSVDDLGHRPEEVARQFTESIRQNLDWNDNQWIPLRRELERQGLKMDVVMRNTKEVLGQGHAQLIRLRTVITEQLPLILKAQIDRAQWAEAQDGWTQLKRVIADAASRAPGSRVLQNMKEAVVQWDAEAYEKALLQLTALQADAALFHQRLQYLRRLEASAPSWAAAIRNRTDIHGGSTLPGNPEEAWLWRQLHDELDKRGRTSMEELQAKIADRSDKLREITVQLVEKKAWSAQVRRTTLSQRQALQGWKLLVRKVGRGTGIRAPRLLAEARKLMPACQSAVPVWIMPMSRVVENFVPGQNRFDVVIIDEASQADVMALTVLYLGNEVLVVGDYEQVSPDAVGQRVDEAQHLIDTYLTDVPNASLYDGKSSIYDLAKTSFREVQLREHFRSVEPIIQFSNYLSYNGAIRPLRDASDVGRRPPTVAYRVDAATLKDKVNEEEARAVASLLMSATEHPAYRNATFGVISLLGDEQAIYIDSLLRKFLPATEYQKRGIRCGNAAQFQGDERDVMFLSVVHVPAADGPLRMLSDPDNRTRKRFNVAASRARDQMWVVHSLDPHSDLKDGDLRKRLILHAQNPYHLDQKVEAAQQQVESEFEKQVVARLIAAGYSVTPQWRVGAYRIDMVVEGGGRRLAIECDGDKWHSHEKLAEDMARQAILERLGWRFVRIRGSHFFRNPDAAMKAVFERLRAAGISPEETPSHSVVSKSQLAIGDAVYQWVIRRAAELRHEWFGQSLELPMP